MSYLKYFLLLCFFFSFDAAAAAQPERATEGMTFGQYYDGTVERRESCIRYSGVLASGDPSVIFQCTSRCEAYRSVAGSYKDSVPERFVAEDMEVAFEQCDSAYRQVMALVAEAKADGTSAVTEKLELKHPGFQPQIDAGYNRCVKSGKSTAECDCLADYVVDRINANGSISRINVVFGRSVASCRGK